MKACRSNLFYCRNIVTNFLLLSLFSALFFASNGVGAGLNSDYYDPRNKNQLQQNERYHFSEENFWSEYKNRAYNYALHDLDFMLRYFPNHPGALSMLGKIAKLTQKTAMPIKYFEKAISLYPQYPMTYVLYGGYLIDIGFYKDAIEKINKAIDLDPKFALAYAKISTAYKAIGDKKLAEEYEGKAVELGYTKE